MSIQADFHMHTSFSEDSDTPMRDMIEGSIKAGLTTICFTEHLDYDFPPAFGTFAVDLPDYQATCRKLAEEYRGRIDIRFGIEFGMQSHLAPRYQQTAKDWPFDFIIGSEHLLYGEDPYYPAFWEKRDLFTGYHDYFSNIYHNIQSMIECDALDTLGHLDYICRYGLDHSLRDYPYSMFQDILDPILELLIRNDKCLEINSAGLKYGLGRPHPSIETLKRYRELGGSLITIGSDAHRPEHIAYDFSIVSDLLKDLGFDAYCIFKNRKPELVSL